MHLLIIINYYYYYSWQLTFFFSDVGRRQVALHLANRIASMPVRPWWFWRPVTHAHTHIDNNNNNSVEPAIVVCSGPNATVSHDPVNWQTTSWVASFFFCCCLLVFVLSSLPTAAHRHQHCTPRSLTCNPCNSLITIRAVITTTAPAEASVLWIS